MREFLTSRRANVPPHQAGLPLPPTSATAGSTSREPARAEPTREGGAMGIQPKRPTAKGPANWFTGDVWIDSLVQAGDDSPINVGAVHFTPGARTAWHSHAGGQTLYVT